MKKENTYTNFDHYDSKSDLYTYFGTENVDDLIEVNYNNLYDIESQQYTK